MKSIGSQFSNDAVLLQKMSQGCKNSFELLYDRYWEKTYSDAYRRLRDEDQAKDIVQEIFTYIWLKREYLHIDNLLAYLHVAVRNKVFKLVEKEKLTHPFFDTLEYIPATYHADDNLLWKEFLVSYEALLNTLPAKRQIIFRMHFQEDLATKDIASRLGITRKTVQNQLGKAIEKIKVVLLPALLFFTILV